MIKQKLNECRSIKQTEKSLDRNIIIYEEQQSSTLTRTHGYSYSPASWNTIMASITTPLIVIYHYRRKASVNTFVLGVLSAAQLSIAAYISSSPIALSLPLFLSYLILHCLSHLKFPTHLLHTQMFIKYTTARVTSSPLKTVHSPLLTQWSSCSNLLLLPYERIKYLIILSNRSLELLHMSLTPLFTFL